MRKAHLGVRRLPSGMLALLLVRNLRVRSYMELRVWVVLAVGSVGHDDREATLLARAIDVTAAESAVLEGNVDVLVKGHRRKRFHGANGVGAGDG